METQKPIKVTLPPRIEGFSVGEGLRYQGKDVELWAKVLSPAALEELQRALKASNAKLNDQNTGFDVCRGDALTAIVKALRRAPRIQQNSDRAIMEEACETYMNRHLHEHQEETPHTD